MRQTFTPPALCLPHRPPPPCPLRRSVLCMSAAATSWRPAASRRWHGKHGCPNYGGPKVPGAPWCPPDPTGSGSNVAMAAGMMRSLRSRRKNKMSGLKYKMQAAAYGGEGVSWTTIFEHYDTDGSGELDFDEFRKAIRRHGRMSVRSVGHCGGDPIHIRACAAPGHAAA